jgi:hypothetical protein
VAVAVREQEGEAEEGAGGDEGRPLSPV